MVTPIPGNVPASPFTSILNFRDVGQTINHLTSQSLLKPGVIYRSARPDEASIQDRESLAKLHKIRTILDLRSKTEHIEQAKKLEARKAQVGGLAEQGDRKTATTPVKIEGLQYKEINLNGGSFSRALLWKLKWTSLTKLIALMMAGYRIEAIRILGSEVMAPRGLIGLGRDSLDFSKGEILQVFKVLSNETNYPVLVHCTQGKDRTGLVILLVLLLCDVPVEAIKADYVASERELEAEMIERMKEIGSIGLGREFAGCPTNFVEEMKTYIDDTYGNAAMYLAECGVEEGMRDSVRRIILG